MNGHAPSVVRDAPPAFQKVRSGAAQSNAALRRDEGFLGRVVRHREILHIDLRARDGSVIREVKHFFRQLHDQLFEFQRVKQKGSVNIY